MKLLKKSLSALLMSTVLATVPVANVAEAVLGDARNTATVSGDINATAPLSPAVFEEQAQRQAEARQETVSAIVRLGQSFLGTRYVFGAKAGVTDAFDCSSFVQYVYRSQGIILPRRSDYQGEVGVSVSRSELQTGDLIFFNFGRRAPGIPDHVGIYIAGNRILHSFPGKGVVLERMVWDNAIFARRVIN